MAHYNQNRKRTGAMAHYTQSKKKKEKLQKIHLHIVLSQNQEKQVHSYMLYIIHSLLHLAKENSRQILEEKKCFHFLSSSLLLVLCCYYELTSISIFLQQLSVLDFLRSHLAHKPEQATKQSNMDVPCKCLQFVV